MRTMACYAMFRINAILFSNSMQGRYLVDNDCIELAMAIVDSPCHQNGTSAWLVLVAGTRTCTNSLEGTPTKQNRPYFYCNHHWIAQGKKSTTCTLSSRLFIQYCWITSWILRTEAPTHCQRRRMGSSSSDHHRSSEKCGSSSSARH
jgi:hypothetical protein